MTFLYSYINNLGKRVYLERDRSLLLYHSHSLLPGADVGMSARGILVTPSVAFGQRSASMFEEVCIRHVFYYPIELF
jgi:hypothetical protein